MSEYTALADLVTLRPLVRREGGRYWNPSPFRASWSNTVDVLAKELTIVGALRTVLEVDLEEKDLRLDGLPRANAIAKSPEVVLSFDAVRVPGKPSLSYRVYTFYRWQDNVRAIALGLAALRAVDRYGVTKRGEQYAGWKAIAAGNVGDGDAAHGRVLIAKASGSVKVALHRAHPDHGGSESDFRDVIAAREAAR